MRRYESKRGPTESGTDGVNMVAGSRMRERRTSGSERGQGTIVVGQGGVHIGWGASLTNTQGPAADPLLAPPRSADPHDVHQLREALPYSP